MLTDNMQKLFQLMFSSVTAYFYSYYIYISLATLTTIFQSEPGLAGVY